MNEAAEILMELGVTASDEAIQAMMSYAKLKCKEQRLLCAENPSDGLSDKQREDIINAPEPNWL
jgi:hypothetical protein